MSTVELTTGDLLDQDVQVIVNAWNRNIIPWWLLLPQGVSGAINVIWRLKQYSPFALQTVPFSLVAPSSISLVLFDSLFVGRRPGWRFGTV